MSELSDGLSIAMQGANLRYKTPDEFKPFNTWDGHSGEAQTPAYYAPVTDHDELLKGEGLDPEKYEVVGEVRRSRWQNGATYIDGEGDNAEVKLRELWSYRFRYRQKIEGIELPALFAAARKARKGYKAPSPVSGVRGAVVVWADPQTGKTGSRGGTEALITRVAEKQAKLDAWLKAQKPTSLLFADVGDGVENFENTSSQMFTNDLSLPDQIDLEATFEFDTIKILTKYGPTKVAKVPSNHGAWRRGKGQLGRPADDWGIHIGRRLEKAFDTAGIPVEFAYPQPEDETLAIDLEGTIIGMQHGHMVNRPEGMPRWWADQVHGAQPIAHADILLTGHFHHLHLQPTGRNPFNGRSKWWIQAPTLDNGSDWYRNLRGDDSDPGLLVFLVDENGFNLQSFDVL